MKSIFTILVPRICRNSIFNVKTPTAMRVTSVMEISSGMVENEYQAFARTEVRAHSTEDSRKYFQSFSLPLWQPWKTLSTLATAPNQSSAGSGTDYESGPVRSPLLNSQLSKGSAKSADSLGRAVLSRIKESPKKVNLVATLVRGMRVEDATAQLAISQKRSSKTVFKVLNAAAANAVNNHGLKQDKLVVAEAFVGKDKFLRRVSIHGRGKSGIRHRPRCILTVIVKEMSAKQEAILKKAVSIPWPRRKSIPLLPHRLIQVGKKGESKVVS